MAVKNYLDQYVGERWGGDIEKVTDKQNSFFFLTCMLKVRGDFLFY